MRRHRGAEDFQEYMIACRRIGLGKYGKEQTAKHTLSYIGTAMHASPMSIWLKCGFGIR